MSLNWKEIDLVLEELDLSGSRIQRILQPTYDSIVFGLYNEGQETDLLISIAHGACRLHALTSSTPKPAKPLRFQECLKSRLRGGRIEAVRQLGTERVIRFDITVARVDSGGEGEVVYKPLGSFAQDLAHGARGAAQRQADDASVGPEILRYRLYARLWSGAGNVILVGEDGTIVDSLARRPARGEVSGEVCRLEEELAEGQARTGKAPREFAIRELPPLGHQRSAKRAPRLPIVEGGSFNERVEAAYAESGGGLSRDSLLEAAQERFEKRRRALEARLAELEKRAEEYRHADRLRELGDILMANQGSRAEAGARTGRFIACEDFFSGGRVDIEVDEKLDIIGNARAYYEKAKKARSGLSDVEAEIEATKSSLEAEKAELERLEATKEALIIARALAKGGTARPDKKRAYPGLSLERKGWTVLVGRSAKENDELLRHHVRGSDLWMHARDYAGSYVFVKAQAGKSFPLDILLDAGNLALYYSKGRADGGGELYYTLAKYLRRAKDGPVGLVLPSHEKNLRVTLDEARLRELKALIGDEG